MPDFGNSFHVLKNDRKLTKEELIRAIRFAMASEMEAVQLYQQIAESIDDRFTQKVLIDIANEEKVHIGEFLKLLFELDPREEVFYKKGMREVEDLK